MQGHGRPGPAGRVHVRRSRSGMGRAVLSRPSSRPADRRRRDRSAIHAIVVATIRRYRGRQRCRDIVNWMRCATSRPRGDRVLFNFPLRSLHDEGRRKRFWPGRHPRVRPETAHVATRSPVFEPFITDKYFRIWQSRASGPHADGASCQPVDPHTPGAVRRYVSDASWSNMKSATSHAKSARSGESSQHDDHDETDPAWRRWSARPDARSRHSTWLSAITRSCRVLSQK